MSGESIAAYVAELRKLTTHCKFKDTRDFLEESQCDWFVCGLRSESTRKQLFQEDKLTFTKAMELAQNLETASKDAQMKATEQLPSGNSTVHKVTSPSQREACHRSGLTNHKANDCRFKEVHKVGKERWAHYLAPQLTGRAQLAFAANSGKYDSIKAAILQRYDINEEAYRRRFRTTRGAGETN